MVASFIPSILNELDDVSITSPASGQVVRHDGTKWENAQLAHSDLSGIGSNSHAQIDTHIASNHVNSFNSRTGVVVPATNDYTWAQINKTTSDIADITTKSHTSLTDIGSNSHATIDSHIADGTLHFTEASISHLNIADIGSLSHATIDGYLDQAVKQASSPTFAGLNISGSAPVFTLTDTDASSEDLQFDIDANIAQIRKVGGAANSLLTFDLANDRIGMFAAPDSNGIVSLHKNVTSGISLLYLIADTTVTKTSHNAMYGFTSISSGGNITHAAALEFITYTVGTGNVTNARAIRTGVHNYGSGTITRGHVIDIAKPVGAMTDWIAIRAARDTGSRTRKHGFYYGSAAVGSEPTGDYAAYFDVDPIALGNATVSGGITDAVKFFSTDDAAGHTIPSFYCEGTNVLATGQADSPSSVRVKMRINGTVVTLLAI